MSIRIVTLAIFVAVAGISQCFGDEAHQEHVHHAGHDVMGFDMTKTVHVFKMTETGGEQKVVLRDGVDAPDQVALIRKHLHHEAEAFSNGTYADPSTLHGANMPGLSDVQANATAINISYADVPNGAMLTFQTSNLHALTAIHRWFGAQLSEHGADARAE